MKVFMTGGAGFVGNAVINALCQKGHSIHALVNHRPLQVSGDRVESFHGDLFDNIALDKAITGCDAAIHLVGIIAEKPSKGITFERIHYQGTMQVVDAVKRAKIQRYLHMSAIGAAPNGPAMYHRTKHRAEEYVRSSGLDWTIIRPSLIHGPNGDFSKMEQRWARGTAMPFLFMPYFANGLLGRKKTRIQPVFVNDVARAFVESLDEEKTIGQVIEIAGPEQMTWPQMHHQAATIIVGKHRATLPIPAWYAKAITHVIPAALLPFTRDQVLMSQQDNVCDLTKFVEMFGWTPQSFANALQTYAK